jgi:hypothetical protein
MREIEFRGKAVLGGRWEYGYYSFEGGYHIIRSKNEWTKNEETTPIIVKGTTVGQFLGLRDIEGKKVYSDDILEIDSDFKKGGRKDIENDVISWQEEHLDYGGFDWSFSEMVGNISRGDQKIKVIGNIFDNRELLKG